MKIGAFVWGVKNVQRAVHFWCNALDYQLKYPMEDDWAILVPRSGDGVQLSIAKISSEQAKRHHIDLFAENQSAEVERLIDLGASRADWNYEKEADYIILKDPDGNPFCVVQDVLK